ncbi:MAG: hypothetical protein ACXWHF_04355 [Chthoniobacterales bacterium]
MNKLITLLAIAAAFSITTTSAKADPDETTQTTFKKLMEATAANDYEAFVAPVDAAMKAAITKPMLEGVSQQMGPRLKQGYDARYLGELNQQGYKVHLWRLQFKDGGDDVLAALSMKDGKAGGFYFR